MSPTGGAALARLRVALLVALAVLLPVLLTTHAPSVVMLAAAAAAVATVAGTSRLPVTPLSSPLVLRQRRPGDVPSLRAGRVTDSPRHPLRPRAPGLV